MCLLIYTRWSSNDYFLHVSLQSHWVFQQFEFCVRVCVWFLNENSSISEPDISINLIESLVYFKSYWFYVAFWTHFCVYTIYWNTDMDAASQWKCQAGVKEQWLKLKHCSPALQGWRALLKQLLVCGCVCWCRAVVENALCVCKTAAGSPIVWLGNSAEKKYCIVSVCRLWICLYSVPVIHHTGHLMNSTPDTQ